MPEAIYLFCFARSHLVPAIEGTGLEDQNPIVLKSVAHVTAVTTIVSLEEFSGAPAESRMQDLAWLGRRACRHEEVVEQVMRRSPVLPVRFGTIFLALEGVEKQMILHGKRISEFLDRVNDQEEWAVKGWLDKSRAKENLFSIIMAGQEKSLSSLSRGKRYLQEQRIWTGIEKELVSWLKKARKGLVEDLTGDATDFQERRLLSREATGRAKDMVLNWAFLLPRRVVANFHERIQRANEECSNCGLHLEPTGPWPPYSFSPSFIAESGS